MKNIIKITIEEIHQLVADRLSLKTPFILEIEKNPMPDFLTEERLAAHLADVVKTFHPAASTGCSGLPDTLPNAGAGYEANSFVLPPEKIPAPLDAYDWAEVFGEGTGGNCTPIIPSAPPGSDVSTETFSRLDVISIFGQEEGENDGADWIVWGQLKDGRWFIARGGCDYTGWDCRAGNSGNVAKNREELIAFGMSEGERERFKLELPGDDKSVPVTDRGESRYFLGEDGNRVYHFPIGRPGTAYFFGPEYLHGNVGTPELWSLDEMAKANHEEITFEKARTLASHVPA